MRKARVRKTVECNRCKRNFLTARNTIFLCPRCVSKDTVDRRLDELEKNAIFKSKYHQHLFTLYLKYVRRFHRRHVHVTQAKRLLERFKILEVYQFKSWAEIYRESKEYLNIYGKPRNSGCPFIKIGHMLQELGCLPPKAEEVGQYIKREYRKLSEDSLDQIRPFIDYLTTTKKSSLTIVRILEILVRFDQWMTSELQADLLVADALLIQRYHNHLGSSGIKDSPRYQAFYYLHVYYRWCKNKKGF